MGTRTDEDDAASRLAVLHQYFREHPVTGPVEGHRTTTEAGTPLNLSTHDHITASVHEVTDHTRAVNPDAGPAPATVDAVYDWCREHTAHAPEEARLRLAVIERRHYLEHSLRAGDRLVIRKERCPKCRTFGLEWLRSDQRAICTNRRCTARDGASRRFTVAHLAHAWVMSQETFRQARAT
ncbi:hypothetical protein D0Z67_29425 (plasmid) [Streptomyces seoulensis]|uniref:Uncharacterized protein n=1 Tax=Streptomyces seoulensis TaxID=73044 RepID=A0A4P6U5I6_STRSO|nr:hypothetical protein [Streptomyces seoulensis]QBJ94491.1 hypothetical protein D0Z67_29425 [Streptomyces seoulensis]